MASETHYPDYNVIDQSGHWDDHTREIVLKRLEPSTQLSFLKRDEAELVGAAAAVLMDDPRPELIAFIVHTIDTRLKSDIGESDRKAGIPPQKTLLRKGLAALRAGAQNREMGFLDLPLLEKQALLGQIERGELPNSGLWQGVPQKEFFTKLLGLVAEAYYSHPVVWSEIGHGGPAYPRGYVRSELGLVDPWEAQRPSWR